MGLILRDNGALNANPPTGTASHLVVHGSDWLWAVDAVYCTTLIVVIGLTYFARQGEKIFHYLFTISLLVGAIAYFTVASDLGAVAVAVSDNLGSHPGTREIFYAKYINWFVGWTPLIIALGLVSGVSWSTIVFNIALSWTWIATWLAGALTGTDYKWGFWTFGLFAYFLLSISLLNNGFITSERLGIRKQYLALSSYLVFFWLLYPIASGLDDFGNEIAVTDGFIFFGILDLFTVPFFTLAILALSTRWDYRTLNIYFTQYGRVAQSGEISERIEREKAAEAAAAGAAPAAEPEQTV